MPTIPSESVQLFHGMFPSLSEAVTVGDVASTAPTQEAQQQAKQRREHASSTQRDAGVPYGTEGDAEVSDDEFGRPLLFEFRRGGLWYPAVVKGVQRGLYAVCSPSNGRLVYHVGAGGLRRRRAPSADEVCAAAAALGLDEGGRRRAESRLQSVRRLAAKHPLEPLVFIVRAVAEYGRGVAGNMLADTAGPTVPPQSLGVKGKYECRDPLGDWWPAVVLASVPSRDQITAVVYNGAEDGMKLSTSGAFVRHRRCVVDMEEQSDAEESSDASESGNSRCSEPPEQLLCPITQVVMEDPYVTKHGDTFEKAAIVSWVRVHKRCPLTRKPLTEAEVFPNRALREMIEAWREVHSDT